MYTLNCKGKLLLPEKPLVMGIINATPDSFVEGHLNKGIDGIVNLATSMIEDGADILDIGGQSTRPGSKRISASEETDRVIPVIEAIIKKHTDIIISVDTYHSKVASAAVDAGACIVNDISGGEMDKQMLTAVASLKIPYICMHMQGTPDTMQQHPHYENVTREVLDFFIAKIDTCKKAGINDIILDPGFGFGKTIQHNFELLKNLHLLTLTGFPLMVGLSRKSTVYKTLEITANDALNGTTTMNTMALMNGANILRVHDVKEAKQAVKLFGYYQKA